MPARSPRALAPLALGLWTIALGVGCGDGGSAAPAPEAEQAAARPAQGAPVIDSVAFKSDQLAAGDEAELVIRASDPDGDRLTTEVHWYVNGKLHREGPRARLDTSLLHYHDTVYAVVQVSDGTHTDQKQTPTLLLGNARPRVLEVQISPTTPRGSDPTSVHVKAQDPENDALTVIFQWVVDGEPLPGATTANLEAGRLKRGQKLRVRAAASDSQGQGPWMESAEVAVGNTKPRIESEPPHDLRRERRYEYDIQAQDPDGDRPLRYQLVEGPAGMDVDLVTGKLTWRLPRDMESGEVPVEIEVSDGHGGSTRQRYSIDIREEKPAVPAARDDARGSRGAAEPAADED